ncbi:MAG: hypothetical protein D6712_14240 [Chloroflexi bacterium]|nr:MAG: hypothetical protein D6712_14240 [Chloroflexota bacterium]
MSNFSRTMATIAIWGAFAAILIAAPGVTGNIFIIIVLAILTGASTHQIWETSGDSADDDQARKTKRIDKTERFLASLSDEELEVLRQRLMAESDGEMVDLESLLR